MPERIVIIGGGRAGNALLEGFGRAEWPAEIAPRSAEAARAVVAKGSIVVLAVPYGARRNVVDELGPALGDKIVIDVTNPLGFPGPEFDRGPESGAQELQRWLPRSTVVKAFNTIFSPSMATAKVGNEQTSAFVATDDVDAKRVVLALARAMGFDAVDAGSLANADGLERLLFFEMLLQKVHGSKIGWRFLHP